MLVSQQADQFLKSKTGQMFMGLILGDGTLTHSRFEHSQTYRYYEYSKHISQQFQKQYPHLLTPKILSHHFRERKRIHPESLIHYQSQVFYTKNHDLFRELRKSFYPDGKKILPIKIIEMYFTEESLLYLYLDDGTIGRQSQNKLSLCLCNFATLELESFQSFLNRRFSYQTTIHSKTRYPLIY